MNIKETSKPVRVSNSSHLVAAQLARELNLSMIEVFDRAIDALERELFFDKMEAAYQQLESSKRLDEFKDEVAAWEATLSDGIT